MASSTILEAFCKFNVVNLNGRTLSFPLYRGELHCLMRKPCFCGLNMVKGLSMSSNFQAMIVVDFLLLVSAPRAATTLCRSVCYFHCSSTAFLAITCPYSEISKSQAICDIARCVQGILKANEKKKIEKSIAWELDRSSLSRWSKKWIARAGHCNVRDINPHSLKNYN